MDSFSGSFPLGFIPFYLDMSSEEISEENPNLAVGSQSEESTPRTQDKVAPQQGIHHQDAIESEAQLKPGSEEAGQTRVGPTPSPSTDESVSAYIERTLQTLGCQGTGLGITFLPPVTSAVPEIERPPESEKTSQSDPIARTVIELPKENAENKTDGQVDLVSEAGFSSARPDYFQTDTSDVE